MKRASEESEVNRMTATKKAKPPRAAVEFIIQMYALQQYKRWSDADLANYLGVSDKTVSRMRADPYSVSGGLILQVQSLLEVARAEY